MEKRATLTIQGQLRAFREAVSVRYKTKIGPEQVLMGWMVRHSAWVVNNFQVKGHGWTPYRSLRGKDYTDVVPFVDLQLLNLRVGCPWKATAKSTPQEPMIQQEDELASGRRAKRLYLLLDKYGSTTGCQGCVGQHTEECRARIEQELLGKGDAI